MATIKRCQICRAPVDERLVWAIGGVCPRCLREPLPLTPAAAEAWQGLGTSPRSERRDDQRPSLA